MKETSGICRSCKEWTDLMDPCCGDLVYVDGGYEDPDDFRAENPELFEDEDVE